MQCSCADTPWVEEGVCACVHVLMQEARAYITVFKNVDYH